MKKIFIMAIGLTWISVTGQAVEYQCKGLDRADKNREVELELKRVTSKKVTFVDQEGDEHELDRVSRSNEEKYKYAVFLDDTYDGYGGFLKLSVPKSLMKRVATNLFEIYYLQHIYSELGHVGTVDIRAVCGKRR